MSCYPGYLGEINRKNMAVRGEFFVVTICQRYLNSEQNDSHSEEINVIDESQAANRPVPVQETEIRWKEVSMVCR